jgi:hypothetical protein
LTVEGRPIGDRRSITSFGDSAKTERVVPSPPFRTGEDLKEAAKEALQSMKWENLEAHARDQ